jgi:hypothetical protein
MRRGHIPKTGSEKRNSRIAKLHSLRQEAPQEPAFAVFIGVAGTAGKRRLSAIRRIARKRHTDQTRGTTRTSRSSWTRRTVHRRRTTHTQRIERTQRIGRTQRIKRMDRIRWNRRTEQTDRAIDRLAQRVTTASMVSHRVCRHSRDPRRRRTDRCSSNDRYRPIHARNARKPTTSRGEPSS